MHAIIRQGEGKYYVSPVFGYYENIKSADDYQRYLESVYSPYYIVWNESRTCLIKWFAMQPNINYMIPQILVIDCNQEDWIKDNDGGGGVDFLPKKLAEEIIESQVMPTEIFEKCKNMDLNYTYDMEPEIKNEKDIENLESVSGGFHDAYIEKYELRDDGSLYIRFEGTWGCAIEVWFWEDVEYNISSRSLDECDPYWYGSTIIIQDDFIYLIDDIDTTVKEIDEGYCWFKARHMKYHVIPD